MSKTHLESEVLSGVFSSVASVWSSAILKFVTVSSNASPVLSSGGGSHFSSRSSRMATWREEQDFKDSEGNNNTVIVRTARMLLR